MSAHQTFYLDQFKWNPGSRTLLADESSLVNINSVHVDKRLLYSMFMIEGERHTLTFKLNATAHPDHPTYTFVPTKEMPKEFQDIEVVIRKKPK